MKCVRCGSHNAEGTKFCMNCGTPLPEGHSDRGRLYRGLVGGGVSAVLVIALICFIFIPSGVRDKSRLPAKKKNAEAPAASVPETQPASEKKMSFTAAAYQVPANQDTDMNRYLTLQGVEPGDVVWKSDSGQAQVGSQGHLVIADYNVNTVLTASSKTDQNVMATCQVSTRSEQDDLAYQVKSLNNGGTETAAPTPDNSQPDAVVINDTNDNTGISFKDVTHKPNKRNTSYQWDNSLFYSLEDINMNSDRDGKINSYDVSRKKFTNLDTGNEMEYEIYKNPSTNKINKIVSIEYCRSQLEIISYYYTDRGKINFIFKKKDTNYVPDYASPDRNGERYYFKNDVMVNWRVVDNSMRPSVVSYPVGNKEYGRLRRSGTDKKLTVYAKCSKKRKRLFDKKEKEMINKAYTTYDKVTTSEGISTIYGYVYDDANRPAAGVDVALMAENYQMELCRVQTDGDGKYAVNVPNREMSYLLDFYKDGCRSQRMYGVAMETTQTNSYGETVYMVPDSGQTYANTLLFYDAAVKYNESQMMPMDSGEANIREGINNKTGDVLLTVQFTDGQTNAELAAGMYTVEVTGDRYTKTFCNIFVSSSGENTHEIYLSGQLRSDEMRIVLTWGSEPPDLDSHLFLPYDGSAGRNASGSAYHIAYYNKQIADGSAGLDVDDTTGYGPETTTIYQLKNGYYKYYVTDFRACCDGDYKSTAMSGSSATVRIYNKNGLARSFYVPVNRKGVIWEVFEIRNGIVVPVQRYYDNVDGKTWYRQGK